MAQDPTAFTQAKPISKQFPKVKARIIAIFAGSSKIGFPIGTRASCYPEDLSSKT